MSMRRGDRLCGQVAQALRVLGTSVLGASILVFAVRGASASEIPGLQPSLTTVSEIESCAEENLPGGAGIVGFAVDALDRSGAKTTSRAELRWRKPEGEQTRILLTVSEPATTAGTALLMIDRDADEPEFFVRLPEMEKVKRIRSRRLRGPVLGTDFSYEDLDRLRDPVRRTDLSVIGEVELAGRRTWVLETIPGKSDRSEYSRVVTFVDVAICAPVRIDLFESARGGKHVLRKRLLAEPDSIRVVPGQISSLPYEFVMRDLERETETAVRIERVETGAALREEDFTRAALQKSMIAPPLAPAQATAPAPASDPPAETAAAPQP